MARIDCPHCGEQLAVARFAGVSTLDCPACSRRLEIDFRRRRIPRDRRPRTTALAVAAAGLAVIAGIGITGLLHLIRAPDTVAVPEATDTEVDAGPSEPPLPVASGSSIQDELDWVSLDSRPEVKAAHESLVRRGEEGAARLLAKRFLARRPRDPWVHEALGHVDLVRHIDSAVADCRLADRVGTASVLELEAVRARAPKTGTWWGAPEAVAPIDALIERVRADERRLQEPAAYDEARRLQKERERTIIAEFPAVRDEVGPYVIFSHFRVARGTPRADVPDRVVREARQVLDAHKGLFGAFYEGWMKHLGPLFGFERYGSDHPPPIGPLQIRFFTDREAFLEFAGAIRTKYARTWRAFYAPGEIPFICTYPRQRYEDYPEIRNLQCHEGTHQLVDFYTWDLLRRRYDHEVPWDSYGVRPMWSNEGFAEFFSSHRLDADGFHWMQPKLSALRDLWIGDEILRRKGWPTWALGDLLEVRNVWEFEWHLRRLDPDVPLDQARRPFASVFYARSWSLVYFLWFAKRGGRFTWRSKYLRYLRSEFAVRSDGLTGDAHLIQGEDFLRTMGLDDEESVRAFEEEWHAFEASLLREHHRRSWDRLREQYLRELGLDPRKTE